MIKPLLRNHKDLISLSAVSYFYSQSWTQFQGSLYRAEVPFESLALGTKEIEKFRRTSLEHQVKND
jgi:hypothetical protein